MKNPAFTTEARRIGRRLALRSLLVYGSLVLGIFLVGVVVLIILDESLRLLVGTAIAAGALAFCPPLPVYTSRFMSVLRRFSPHRTPR